MGGMRPRLLALALLPALVGGARAAERFLGEVENVPSLATLTRRRWSSFRAGGAFAIGVLGARAEPVVDLLIERLGDGNRPARSEAAWALLQMGSKAVEPLRPALRHRRPKVRMRAAIVLGALGARARPALPDLAAAQEDEDRRVRYAAFRARQRILGRRQ